MGHVRCIAPESQLTQDLESRLLSRRRLPNRQRFLEDQKAQGESRVLERFQSRDWRAGDIYAPHDLSPAEMKKWMKRYSPSTDAFDALNINPLGQYKVSSFEIISEPRYGNYVANWVRSLVEFLYHVRIYDANGPYKAPESNRFTSSEPAENCKSHPTSNRSRPHAKCPSTS
jgi:hypothetical protein